MEGRPQSAASSFVSQNEKVGSNVPGTPVSSEDCQEKVKGRIGEKLASFC